MNFIIINISSNPPENIAYLKSLPHADQENNIDKKLFRIVGGRNTDVETYPFIVSLQSEWKFHFCGGSIISAHVVLTACHCLQSRLKSTVYVLAGQTDLSAPEVSTSQRVKVKEIILHPEYDSNLIVNDIGCCRLMSSLEFSKTIRPLKVPSSQHSGDLTEIVEDITVLGWGNTAANRGSSILKAVDLPVVSLKLCNTLYKRQKILNTQMCTMFKEGGKDSCQGDSGGPLVSKKYKFVQYGIVSFGEGCARENMPAVNTRVDSYLDFILKCLDLNYYFHNRITPGKNDISRARLSWEIQIINLLIYIRLIFMSIR